MIRNFTGRALPIHQSKRLEELHDKLRQGEKLSVAERKELERSIPAKSGIQKTMGWAYDFREFMTKYVVKTDHYLEECYGFSKGQAREHFKGLGKVHYIVEVPNPMR
jgi:hypothetical protein